MLLYYHSWMFYNHFIATLYHFLGLTYWPSAQSQLLFFACFLHRRKSIPNGVQTQWNSTEIFDGLEDIHWARAAPRGCLEGGTTHQGPLGSPGVPRWVVPTSVASRTPSLHYIFPNIPKPFGVNLDHKFRRHRALYPSKTNLDPFLHPARGGNHLRWPSSSSRRPPRWGGSSTPSGMRVCTSSYVINLSVSRSISWALLT